MSYAPFTIGKYFCEGGKENVLGRGSYGYVYRATDKETGELVAIKVVDIARVTKVVDKKSKQHLKSEISLLEKLQHPNIVKLLYVNDLTDDFLYMVFEYCGGGDLSKYISQNKHLSEEMAKKFMTQLAAGLKYLHSLHIIHRDLKPHNLLLTSTNKEDHILKIADFGFAKTFDASTLSETVCGSPLYMAPEILKGQKYSSKADLWSVGTILFEMITGKPPFPARSTVELISMIDKQEVIIPDNFDLSVECKSLMKSLLQKDPAVRISCSEFFMNPWLDLASYRKLDSSNLNRSRATSFGSSSLSPSYLDTPRSRSDSFQGFANISSPFSSIQKERSSISSRKRGASFGEYTLDSSQLNDIKRQQKRINAIGTLAQFKSESNDKSGVSECIVLLIKLLSMLDHLFETGQQKVDPEIEASLKSDWSRYLHLFELQIIRLPLESEKSLNPDKIIYEGAIQLAKVAIALEKKKEFSSSALKYEHSLLLFEYLICETNNQKEKGELFQIASKIDKKITQIKTLPRV